MTDAKGAHIAPLEKDSRYYEEAATWERDRVRAARFSRGLAWTVATMFAFIAIGCVGVLALVVPLKSFEPYVVLVDKTTGYVEVKRALAPGDLHEDEAVTTANVVRYIRARETYDPKALKDNFDLAQLLATGEAARDLTEIFSPANPKNPIHVLGRSTTVAVEVKSVTFPNQSTAFVRFATEEKSPTNIVTRHWVALVRFRYSSAPMKNEFRFDNPLGFQVTDYRRDQETADTPDASAAQWTPRSPSKLSASAASGEAGSASPAPVLPPAAPINTPAAGAAQ